MSANDRVRKHRAKLQDEQRCRLEVCIGIPLIDKVRQITNKPMSLVVQDALQRYVEEHRELVSEAHRLDNERARLLAQADSPGCRLQIEEYNRQLAAFNERLARFRQPH